MRSRRLLTLLSLLVLLLQPIALLHGLTHLQAKAQTTSVQAPGQGSDATAPADDAVCLQCLAFGALGAALLPAVLVLQSLRLRHAALPPPAVLLRGGTGAGYHARAPPVLL